METTEMYHVDVTVELIGEAFIPTVGTEQCVWGQTLVHAKWLLVESADLNAHALLQARDGGPLFSLLVIHQEL